VAVNTRVLAGSLAAAVLISLGGGYLLSRSDDSPSDAAELPRDTVLSAPGIPTNKPVSGEKLPAVNLVDVDGNTISTADLVGHPLVINVWSVTCEACKTEMPALARVQADLGDSVRFVYVNTLKNNEGALDFAKDKGVVTEIYSDHNGELTGALGVTGLPYTLFVTADGTIAAQKGIALDEADIRAAIDQNLLS
jgi:cytochrome c biogenesis protein CcmG, thiol:disulfide interchange protein DsbE